MTPSGSYLAATQALKLTPTKWQKDGSTKNGSTKNDQLKSQETDTKFHEFNSDVLAQDSRITEHRTIQKSISQKQIVKDKQMHVRMDSRVLPLLGSI
jgi:hypothetical protein